MRRAPPPAWSSAASLREPPLSTACTSRSMRLMLRSMAVSCWRSFSCSSVVALRLSSVFFPASLARRLVISTACIRNSTCSLTPLAWSKISSNFCCEASWNLLCSPASARRSSVVWAAAELARSRSSWLKPVLVLAALAWTGTSCLGSRTSDCSFMSLEVVSLSMEMEFSTLESRSVKSTSRTTFVGATDDSLKGTTWGGGSPLYMDKSSSLNASRAADCLTSWWDTMTSNLSSRARTSLTSWESAFVLSSLSTFAESAFFANSAFRVSRCPRKTDSAIASTYCLRSASFLSTELCSCQLTFLPSWPWTSATSSRFEKRARHFRLESWNVSSSLCSNSWKAKPMARRRSVSEIKPFIPTSNCETTSC
mmetsp:Transcript_26663/g.79533  ORF Transcript_26663/g.79533 Transcript_26663/m.79533 type:complete len:367 (+) Transcript_26663:669-1769(+)